MMRTCSKITAILVVVSGILVTTGTGSQAYLKSLSVSYQGSEPGNAVKEYYSKSGDINKGQGGKFVWLIPSWTYNKNEAVTGIYFVRQTQPDGNYNDLAKGAGGDYRYLKLSYSRNSNKRFTDVWLFRSSTAIDRNRFGYVSSDINQGRGGDFLYLVANVAYV